MLRCNKSAGSVQGALHENDTFSVGPGVSAWLDGDTGTG
jgi:hypothetical protein